MFPNLRLSAVPFYKLVVAVLENLDGISTHRNRDRSLYTQIELLIELQLQDAGGTSRHMAFSGLWLLQTFSNAYPDFRRVKVCECG